MRGTKKERTEDERKGALYGRRNVVPQWKSQAQLEREALGKEEESDGPVSQTDFAARSQITTSQIVPQFKADRGPQVKKKKVRAEDRSWLVLSRPYFRGVLTITAWASFVYGCLAFWAAVRAIESTFWYFSSNGVSLDFQQVFFWGLVIEGFVSLMLCYTGLSLINVRDPFFKYFSSIGSLLNSLVMLAFGIPVAIQAVNLSSNIDGYCSGSFPDLNFVTEVYLNTFFEIQHDYIERTMCQSACPCSPKIDPTVFGQRQEEFSLRGLDVQSGMASAFYDDCYLPRVSSKATNEIDPHILDLLREMESTYNCQGLCEANLFYFFRSSQYGPPPSDCR